MNWESLQNTRKTRQNARATPRRVSIRLAIETRAKRKPRAKARDVCLRKTITKGMRFYFRIWYKTFEHTHYARDIYFAVCMHRPCNLKDFKDKETNNG